MADIRKLLQIKEELKPYNATLVAVSKTKPIEEILEVAGAGQVDFGENYVQELCEKKEKISENLNWHFIGHLQSNKVKSIVPFIHLIHGIDSLNLLKEVEKQSAKIRVNVSCLLQIYIAEEESKFGLSEKEADEILQHPFEWINIRGFMGMATNTSDEKQIRKEFTALRNLFEIKSVEHGLSVLSMGMSSDYKVALDCGSNMVRIGSAIFGERSKSD